jgi:uncharacterized protein (UPF0335 family)
MTSNSDLARRIAAIASLEDQRKDITTEIADRYQDAKNQGYNVPSMRRAVKVNRMDASKRAKHDSDQMDFEMYLAEVEGRQLREAAE